MKVQLTTIFLDWKKYKSWKAWLLDKKENRNFWNNSFLFVFLFFFLDPSIQKSQNRNRQLKKKNQKQKTKNKIQKL